MAIAFSAACAGKTATPPAVKEEAPASPTAESRRDAEIPFTQTGEVFHHTSGSFSIPKLKDWEMRETEDGALFSYQKDAAQLHISVTNTGAELPHATLEVFAFGVEDALYVKQPDYNLINIVTDPGQHTVELEKIFTQKGAPYYNRSIYYSAGTVVYMMEVTLKGDSPANIPFEKLFKSIDFNVEKAAAMPIYQAVKTYTSPEARFSIEVPLPWFISSASPNPQTIIETITPPDRLASIQILSFNNPVNWQPEQTDRAALLLINEFLPFSGNNIRVGFTQPPKDGKGRRMDWTSIASEYEGTTYYEVYGTQLLLITFAHAPEGAELYPALMKRIANSIRHP